MTPPLFGSFHEWGEYLRLSGQAAWNPVMDYEITQKSRTETEIWDGLARAYAVMKDAVETGLSQDMTSFSGLINNGAKKVRDCKISVLGERFQKLVYRSLAAKEVNSCMGRVVAAPTAGASGIMPGCMVQLQEDHGLSDRKIYEAMLVAAAVPVSA
jgi:L-serine dehydratase